MFEQIDKLYLDKLHVQLNKASVKALSFAWDHTSVTTLINQEILHALPKGVRNPYPTWEELRLLFSSPYLNLQTEIEDRWDSEILKPLGKRSMTALIPYQPNFKDLRRSNLFNIIVGLGRIEANPGIKISEDLMIRIIRLRYGPESLLTYSLWKYRSPAYRDLKEARKSPLKITKSRISRYQEKIAFRGYYLRLAVRHFVKKSNKTVA
jgi:hypothetical protein